MLGDGDRTDVRSPDPSERQELIGLGPDQGRLYRLRPRMNLDLVKGGWMWIYEILDGDRVVGVKAVGRTTRHAAEVTTFYLLDAAGEEAVFATADEFRAAYEATL
jgi:hypothetical protein